MAARVHMQGVGPIADDQPGQRQALLHAPVALPLHIVVRGKLHDHRKAGSALLLTDLDQFLQKPCPVFQAAAVAICPGVPAPGQKLIREITAVGMDLHAVRPAAQGRLDRPAVVRFQKGDLLQTQRMAFQLGRVHPAAWAGADRDFIPGAGPADASVSGHDLGAHHAAVAVAALHNPAKQRLRLLREEDGMIHGLKAVRALHVAENQGSPALGPLHKIVHGGSVHISHGHAHGSHDHSVFQFHPSDSEGLCQYG